MPSNPYPMSWQDRRSRDLQNALNNFGVISGMGRFSAKPDQQYDYLQQAENMAFQAAKVRNSAAQSRAYGQQFAQGSPQGLQSGGGNQRGQTNNGSKLSAFLKAIAGQESGGNYGARNSSSGAMGKYQIMPGNIAGPGGWDQEILGRNVSNQQFMSHPKLQEAIAQGKLTQYFKKYGPAGAASAWYSGSPNKWNSRTPQGAYPSIHNYVLAILRRAGLQ